MPFCASCGTQVEGKFCPKCGAAIVAGGAAPPPPAQGASASPVSAPMADNVASTLCYVLGLITGIIFLVLEPYSKNRTVRFHAFQGLYVFVAWLIVDWVISPFLHASGWLLGMPFHRMGADLLQLAVFAAWVFMMIKVSHDENYKLPIIGDLAERSVSEQRS